MVLSIDGFYHSRHRETRGLLLIFGLLGVVNSGLYLFTTFIFEGPNRHVDAEHLNID